MATKTKLSVLIIDDQPDVLDTLAELLREKDINVICCTSPEEAHKIIESEKPDAIVTDIYMPTTNGVEFSKALRRKYPIVMTTGMPSYDIFVDIMDACDAYIDKVDAPTQLYCAINKAIERKHEKDEKKAA